MQKLTKNIDLVQINVTAGQEEYFLPKNVDWNGQRIDRIALVAPGYAEPDMYSPTDGRRVLSGAETNGLYLDLYNGEDQPIAVGLSRTHILERNNNPWLPNSTLSLDLSRLYFAEAPEEDGCLLLYVYYGGEVELTDEPSRRNKTVRFALAPNEQISFQDMIDSYIHVDGHKVRGIQVWKGSVYLNLRDHSLSYIFRHVHSSLMLPPMQDRLQVEPLKLTGMDIDFDYSTVQNATDEEQSVVITFEY